MRAHIVVNDFADYRRGDQITDPAAIARVIEHGQQANTVPTELPDPAPDDSAAA